MNWIDPKVQLPEEGRVYLVLWSFNNTMVVGFSYPGYPRRYNSETERYESRKDKGMIWKSLYNQARTKAVTFDGRKISECKEREGEPRPYYFIETLPNDYPIANTIAYIAMQDIEYPIELMNTSCICTCGGKK